MDEEHSAPLGDGRFVESKTGHIDAGKFYFLVGDAFEIAFKIICPVMVGTGDGACRFSMRSQHACAAVSADIVKRSQSAFIAPNNNEAVEASLDRYMVTRIRKVFWETNKSPGFGKNGGLFLVEPRLGCIGLDRQNRHETGFFIDHEIAPMRRSAALRWCGRVATRVLVG